MMRTLSAFLLMFMLAGVGCNDIGRLRRNRDTESLVRLLSHEDPHVRVKAIDALGKVGDSRTVDSLIKSLRDQDQYVREHAARNLGCDYHSTLGCELTSTIEPLIETLDDDDTFVRVEAARSLGENPSEQAREPLEKAARTDNRWEVRLSAVDSLSRIGLEESLPVIEDLLDDDEELVRRAARRGLRRINASRRVGSRGDTHHEEEPSEEPDDTDEVEPSEEENGIATPPGDSGPDVVGDGASDS